MVRLCLLPFVASILLPSGAAAQQCSPAAGQAIHAWEARTRTALTEGARKSTVDAFCGAAARLSQEEGVSSTDINAAAGDVLGEYLDDALAPGATSLPIADILGAQFSVNANASIPVPRQLGRIEVVYRRTVDALLVGGDRVPAYPALLSPFGDIPIAGVKANATVCSGHVMVGPATARFTC